VPIIDDYIGIFLPEVKLLGLRDATKPKYVMCKKYAKKKKWTLSFVDSIKQKGYQNVD